MDQAKIGKFIAEQRKEKKLTQAELAEKLGVSTNAVSKWERGICLMDMSLLKPLSICLGVSVNDILSGKKVDETEIGKKSEENLISLSELTNLKTMRYGIIGMAIFFMVLVTVSTIKEISPAPLTALICAYNAITMLSRYKINHDKSNLFTGVLFLISTVMTTVTFFML